MNPSMLPVRRGGGLLPVVALLLALLTCAGAAPRFVMKIQDHDGSTLVPGDYTEPGYEDWIELRGFGQGVSRPSEALDPESSDVVVFKELDKASPLLQGALLTGRTLPTVIIKDLGERQRGTGPERGCLELHHVLVTSYALGSGAHSPIEADTSDRPTEEVAFYWSKVVYSARHLGDGGVLLASNDTEHVFREATEDPAFDDDLDGLANDVDEDDDGDRMHDRYEEENGLNPLVDDAGGDADGDRRSNLDESIAGTRANDHTDYFRIESLNYDRSGDEPTATLALAVKPGRHYRLLATADPGLPKDQWMVVDEFATTADSTDEIIEIVLEGPLVENSPRLFFEAEVSLP